MATARRIILKAAVGMDEIAQVAGAEGLWKNRRRTRSGPVRFFQSPAVQQVTQDRHEQLPFLGLWLKSPFASDNHPPNS
jgi:hypothetical protein